ncbi:DUSAM domain-containing protein [Pyxidicoccus parkwayensis]|uniref:DUSAM domain-containing protein n=1 Tax=Pyxidicoccus parkwayensis TaxID=2813578 RepID=A0ABX7P0L5_9BACT|nr:DUSAM domain-containing protein [Pyxidicoccus parkwaysis]QSQ23257.1 DUSAM domain-containing protein [Pyxidicoccus parkwaysis]
MSDTPNWHPFRALARQTLREGAPLVLTDEVRALLLRTAREVALADADAAVRTDTGALALIREAARRITDGSNRLTDAIHRMHRHRNAGDFDSARQEMRDVLAVEVVPYYRLLAQEQLDDMADDP